MKKPCWKDVFLNEATRGCSRVQGKAVTSAGNMAKEHLIQPQVIIEQPGEIYICVYNRSDSPNGVYFDDLTIKHTHGPIVAGSDYCPYGMVMDGREVKDDTYRYGYQGQFSEKDEKTGWNDWLCRR